MQGERRAVITREEIRKKLRRELIPGYAVVMVLTLICLVAFLIGMGSMIKTLAQNPQENIMTLAFSAGVVLVTAGIAIGLIVSLAKDAKRIGDVFGNRFVIEHVPFVSHEIFDRRRSLDHSGYDRVIFEGNKTYSVFRNRYGAADYPSPLSTALQLSAPGDLYVVVTLASDPQTIVDLYCEKFYAYRE